MRRSSRVPTPTLRALQYKESNSFSTQRLPEEGDTVAVYWSLKGDALWWPASVIKIHEIDQVRLIATATVQYHQLKDYGCEDATVIFQTGTRQEHQIVSSATSRQLPSSLIHLKDSCSWMFTHDADSTDHRQSPVLYNSNNEKQVFRDTEKMEIPHPQGLRRSKRTASSMATVPPLPPPHASVETQLAKSPVSSPSSRINVKEKRVSRRRISATSTTLTTQNETIAVVSGSTRQLESEEFTPTARNSGSVSRVFNSDIVNGRRRVNASAHQISTESANADVNATPGTRFGLGSLDFDRSSPASNTQSTQLALSSNQHSSLQYSLSAVPTLHTFATRQTDSVCQLSIAAASVLLRLKWSLLTRLEKPLSDLKFPDIHRYGIASNTITAKCDCDSVLFAAICKILACRHGLLPDSAAAVPSLNNPSRIRFFPDYHRTQSRSTCTEKLIVSFSTLVDVMDILGLRDEDDYELVLSKEKKSESDHILQTFGTLLHLPVNEGGSANQHSGCSIITTSDVTPFLRLYIGSAPCTTMVAEKDRTIEDKANKGPNTDTPSANAANAARRFHSLLLEQDCRHFSLEKLCFRTPWRSRRIRTAFTPLCEDFIGSTLLSEPDPDTSFLLKWSRMKTPSSKKWSRDVQETGVSSPGHLSLSLPVIYTSSRSNVNALSQLLDKDIEFLLNQRQSIQYTLNN